MVLDGLTAADLMYECAACNGSGKIYNPVWDRYNAAAIDPARELPLPPMLDSEEPQMPEPPPEPEHINCPNCRRQRSVGHRRRAHGPGLRSPVHLAQAGPALSRPAPLPYHTSAAAQPWPCQDRLPAAARP